MFCPLFERGETFHSALQSVDQLCCLSCCLESYDVKGMHAPLKLKRLLMGVLPPSPNPATGSAPPPPQIAKIVPRAGGPHQSVCLVGWQQTQTLLARAVSACASTCTLTLTQRQIARNSRKHPLVYCRPPTIISRPCACDTSTHPKRDPQTSICICISKCCNVSHNQAPSSSDNHSSALTSKHCSADTVHDKVP